MWKLIDSKGRTCMVHSDRALVQYWADVQWSMFDYKIVNA